MTDRECRARGNRQRETRDRDRVGGDAEAHQPRGQRNREPADVLREQPFPVAAVGGAQVLGLDAGDVAGVTQTGAEARARVDDGDHGFNGELPQARTHSWSEADPLHRLGRQQQNVGRLSFGI